MLLCLSLVLATTLAWPSLVFPGPNGQSKVVVHLVRHRLSDGDGCALPDAQPSCAAIKTNGLLYSAVYFAYLLVVDGNSAAGVAAVHCGVSFNAGTGSGFDVFSWSLCGDIELQRLGWPQTGGGNTIAWDSTIRCQRNEPGGPGSGVIACAGYFYCGAKSSDRFLITPNPFTSIAFVRDCSGIVDTLDSPTAHRMPSPLGYADFSPAGNVPGYNPCGLTTGISGVPGAVEARTWTRIKGAYVRR